MSKTPHNQKIYHITHIDNLASILSAECIWSEADCLKQSVQNSIVGISEIKQRRLYKIEVSCHPGTKVGEYVPFYFCPRSIMLYLLYRSNHQDLNYRDGQDPILHLEIDLAAAIQWTNRSNKLWAFSDRNAGAYFANFYANIDDFSCINWEAVTSKDFRDPEIREPKQAEFLIYQSFPWHLVERVGVFDLVRKHQVESALKKASHQPPITIEPNWYF